MSGWWWQLRSETEMHLRTPRWPKKPPVRWIEANTYTLISSAPHTELFTGLCVLLRSLLNQHTCASCLKRAGTAQMLCLIQIVVVWNELACYLLIFVLNVCHVFTSLLLQWCLSLKQPGDDGQSHSSLEGRKDCHVDELLLSCHCVLQCAPLTRDRRAMCG